MKPWRKSLAVLSLSGASVAAAVVGVDLYEDVQFARAEQQVQATREELSTVQDMASVFREVGRVVEPSVVNIRVTKTVSQTQMPGGRMFRRFFRDFGGPGQPNLPPEFGEGGPMKEIGTGSGVIVEASNGVGYILTNNHVAGGASEMDITLADGREIKDAKLVGADPKTDLAVVEIKADHLIPAKWGDSSKLQPGDWVMAFGSPFGYVGSMTHGIVSALHRQAGILGSDGYENFIQVDAPINPGNSGGPLVDVHGDMVGINTAIASSSGGFQGIGFAIPANQAKPIYEALKHKGSIVRGWLGVQIENVAQARDEVKSEGYTGDTGVLVKGVMKDTPASGKLRPGDVVSTLNGKPVRDASQLRNEIALDTPGTEVTLGIVRDGKKQDVKITLGQQPGNPNVVSSRGGEGQQTGKLGLGLADLTDELAQRFGVNAKEGAVVVAVRPGSPAAQAGVRPGDVITRVDKENVTSAQQAGQDLARADLKKGIRLDITNREGSEFVFVQSEQG